MGALADLLYRLRGSPLDLLPRDRQAGTDPRQAMAGATGISAWKSPYEPTLAPGETRSPQELQTMLANAFLGAGAMAAPASRAELPPPEYSEVKPGTGSLGEEGYWNYNIEPTGSFSLRGKGGEKIAGAILKDRMNVESAGIPEGGRNPNEAIQAFSSMTGLDPWLLSSNQTVSGGQAVDRMVQTGRLKAVPGEPGYKYDFTRPSSVSPPASLEEIQRQLGNAPSTDPAALQEMLRRVLPAR